MCNMNKLAVCILSIFMISCADKKKSDIQVAIESSVPEGCVQTADANWSYEEWGSRFSNNYSCTIAGLEKMTCTYHAAVDGSHKELKCQNTLNTNPQSVPNGCRMTSLGWREFFDGTYASADDYDCGKQFGLSCRYFQHRPDASGAFNRDEFLCID